jgi:Ca2+-transporting ATPase
MGSSLGQNSNINININVKNDTPFHTMSADSVIEHFKTRPEGLTDKETADRFSTYGKNELVEPAKRTIIQMVFEQLKSVMIIILIIAAVISGFLGEFTDTIIIFIVVILNAIIGVIQESKAERALEALKQMSKPFAKVRRNGQVIQVKTEDIVPGDIVIIEAGDYVPADMRLIDSANLKIEEAALTGESVPVEKSTGEILEKDIVIGDRRNMAYLGSSVTYGRGAGVVTATGMNTEVGKIAGYLTDSKETEETPLQKKLAEMSRYLSIGVIAIAIVIFIIGLLQGRAYLEMLLTSISLAVAAMPEGLPAIVTIVLAIGVQKMAKKNAVVRRLPAVETLGSTEIICSDKTGTLTQNKMTVKEVFFGGKLYSSNEKPEHSKDFDTLLQIMVLCNDSKVTKISKSGINVSGDPTETALVTFAAKNFFLKDEIEKLMPRIGEIPFDSDRKLMTIISQFNAKFRAMTKGAPDILLDKCVGILINGKIEPVHNNTLQNIKKINSDMAGRALRVLAMAFKDMDDIPESITPENIEHGLIFAGLVGMIDPPREEVKEAVRICKNAGITPIMITGDHRDTAAAIANELNISDSKDQVIIGSELDKISEDDFKNQVSRYSVYARVSPEHKVRIVKAWKEKGKIVAMTGDGVNDAPALKIADIGIGMGITGTDVAKGVSDIVLSDDNFSTIVSAVKEGRKIYSNIRKSVQFLLSANIGEVITLFVATLLNWKILFPIHILWINLITDTLPALALGVEKAEEDIMKQKPRKSTSGFFAGGLGINILYQGLFESAITLGIYYIGLKNYSVNIAITMAFMALGLIQLTHSFNVRTPAKSLFKTRVFSNRYLVGAVAVSTFLQIIVVLVPPLNEVFKVEPLNYQQWLLVIFASLLIIPIVELVKLTISRRQVQVDL